VFRVSGQKFDGGLIDNLPIDYLAASPEDGQILAVGFEEDAYSKVSDGAFSLAASLLDASMTSKTRSTKRTLGPNSVLSLSPDAGDDIVVDMDRAAFADGCARQGSHHGVRR
jgi:predicted acylesterase/phospholipase RssA